MDAEEMIKWLRERAHELSTNAIMGNNELDRDQLLALYSGLMRAADLIKELSEKT